jgi:hypothetical protein
VSNTNDYWDPDDSQQLLGDFEGTVLQSFWSTMRIQSQGKIDGAGADNTQLYWLVSVDEVWQEYDKIIPESVSINFGIGEKWRSDESGRFVEHEDDPDPAKVASGDAKAMSFKGGSMYGKWLGLCGGRYDSYYTQTNVDPLVADLRVLDDGPELRYDLSGVRAIQSRRKVGNPRDASIWVGLRFRFRGVGFVYKQTKGTPSFKVMPFSFLGFSEDVAASYDPNSAGTIDAGDNGASSVVTEAALVSETLVGASGELVETLTTLVSNASSHPEFMKGALKIPEVKGNPDIKASVMNANTGPWSKRGVTLEDAEAARVEAAQETAEADADPVPAES